MKRGGGGRGRRRRRDLAGIAVAYGFELRLRGEALVLVHSPLSLDTVFSSLRRRLAAVPLLLLLLLLLPLLLCRRQAGGLVLLLPAARRLVEHQRPAASNQDAASRADGPNAPRRVPVAIARRGAVRPVPADVLAFPVGEEEPPSLAVAPVLLYI